MRIGVFGGSFNPPHIGHQIVAEHARDALRLDRVLWVPNNIPPHRDPAGVATADRLRMVERAVQGNSGFEVSRLELDREGPSYMVDTLRLAQSDGDHLFLIIGMDSLLSFSSWRAPEEICRLAQLAVYPRNVHRDTTGKAGANTSSDTASNADLNAASNDASGDQWPFIELDAPVVDVSSTSIRDRIYNGRTVRYLVPESVHDYISEHKLYREL